MIVPSITNINHNEFDAAEDIYKIIVHDGSIVFGYFELANNKYYIGWISPDIIKVDFKILEKENYLLVGVDLKVVVLCIKTGRILFSLGLFSFFKGFEDTRELAFTIFSDIEDIVVNKNGLSISQTIPHELEY